MERERLPSFSSFDSGSIYRDSSLGSIADESDSTEYSTRELVRGAPSSASIGRPGKVKRWVFSHKLVVSGGLIILLGIGVICAVVLSNEDSGGSVVAPTEPAQPRVDDPPPSPPPSNMPPVDPSDDPPFAPVSPTPLPVTPSPTQPDKTQAPTTLTPTFSPTTSNPPTASKNPTAAPLPSVMEMLTAVSNLTDPTSPQSLAAEWLITLDQAFLMGDSPNLYQRFALAAFYFSTGGAILPSNEAWDDCNASPSPLLPDETASEVRCISWQDEFLCTDADEFETCQYVNKTTGTTQEGFRFLSSANECQWFGMGCNDDGRVVSIDLEGNDLRGVLPVEMRLLESLTSLDLGSNSITPPIFSDFTSLPQLESLSLSNNAIAGPIPSTLYQMANLVRLELDSNEMDGTLTSDMIAWQKLKYLNLASNKFEGGIPKQIKELKALEELSLAGNAIVQVPKELYDLTNLTQLHLESNQLQGTVHVNIGRLLELKSLSMHENQLSGRIPRKLGLLPKLTFITLHFNDFVGSVPACDTLTNLTMFSADCLEDVTCPCCTHCF